MGGGGPLFRLSMSFTFRPHSRAMSGESGARQRLKMPAEGEKDSLLDSMTPALPRKQLRPPPDPRRNPRTTRSLHLSLTLGILALFVLYARQNGSQLNTYAYGGKKMPQQYAICSKEGKNIYTVPEEGGVGAVECVVVSGKEVIDTGSIGQSPVNMHFDTVVELFYSTHPAQMAACDVWRSVQGVENEDLRFGSWTHIDTCELESLHVPLTS